MKTIFISIFLFIGLVVVFLVFFQFNTISGNAMSPNYLDDQSYVSSKITYWFSQPQRGDVVIYTYPLSSEVTSIGRIVGLPNESININNNGQVYINGQLISESYLSPNTFTYSGQFNDFVIDKVSYFILTDSRNLTTDSRTYGPVKYQDIKSKVVFKY